MFFDLFDRHWWLVDPQHTGRLARCRTDTTGELGKVIGRCEDVVRFFKIFSVYGIIELRYHITKRATAMAEWNAAVHATRRLFVKLLLAELLYEFFIVMQPFLHRHFTRHFPGKVFESCWLTH